MSNTIPKISCIKCKEVKFITEFWNNKKSINRYFKTSYCKSCSKKSRNKNRCKNEINFIKYLLQTSYSLSKKRGKNGRKEAAIFDINLEYIQELLRDQNYKCILSGRILKFEQNNINKISIDRIDNNKGYIKGNIRLVCWCINQSLNDLSDDDFVNMCQDVIKFTDTCE